MVTAPAVVMAVKTAMVVLILAHRRPGELVSRQLPGEDGSAGPQRC